MDRSLLVMVAVACIVSGNQALPLEREAPDEDMVKRCLVQVLSKALSKTVSHPIDPDCKHILQTVPGVRHEPPNSNTGEGALPQEQLATAAQPEAPETKQENVKDIEAFLKSVEEKRETPGNQPRQEMRDLFDMLAKGHKDGETDEGEDEEERDKRWKPTHRYHHKRRYRKRGDETPEEEEDYDRSQESWDLDNGIEKRKWRPGRFHQRRQKRDEELSEDAREIPDEDRSQESSDFNKRHETDEDARGERIWKPSHRYHHKIRLQKRGGDLVEEEDEQRSESENNGEEKKPEGEESARERDRVEALRFLTEKTNPGIYNNPSWSNNSSATSHDMEDKVLRQKMKQGPDKSDDKDRSNTHQEPLMPQEEMGSDNLAAMTELKKMAAKLHGNPQ